MKILGISGRIGAGKDSLADFLAKNQAVLFGEAYWVNVLGRSLPVITRPGRAEKIPFACGIKDFCHDYLGVPRELLYGDAAAKECPCGVTWEALRGWEPTYHPSPRGPLTVRELMDFVGEHLILPWWPRVWLDYWRRRAEASGADVVIAADVRKPEQVALVQSLGGKVVRLTRASRPECRLASEVALDGYPQSNYDWVLDNVRMTLPESERALLGLLAEWGWCGRDACGWACHAQGGG